MAIEELRRVLCKKLSNELQLYKFKKLSESPGDIYDSAYEIDCMISIYEVMIELVEECDCDQLQMLNDTPDLLWMMYGWWLKTEDSVWQELRKCVKGQIETIKSIETRIGREMLDEKTGINSKYYKAGVA